MNLDISYNLFRAVFEHASNCAPTLERLVGIAYNDNQIFSKSVRLVNNKLEEEEINTGNLTDAIIKRWVKDYQNYTWINHMPFDETYSGINQLSLQSEIDRLTLAVCISNVKCNINILLFLKLNKNSGSFGMRKNNDDLSTQSKTIFASTIYNSLSSLIISEAEHQNNFIKLSTKSFKLLKNKKNSRQEEFLNSWADYLLQEISNSDGLNYVYSKKCKDIICSGHYGFDLLNYAIRKGAEYAKLLFTYVNGEDIVIEDSFLDLDNYSKVSNKVHDSVDFSSMTDRMKKCYLYLEKLEKSANILHKNGQKIIGKSLGENIDKPCSDSAISDFLSKNRDTINRVMNKYPEKWNLIRNNFKPIININLKGNNSIANTLGA